MNKWCVLAITSVLACGGSRTVGKPSPGSDPEAANVADAAVVGDAPIKNIARTVLSLEVSAESTDPPSATVTLIMTDESGNTERSLVGTFEGECKRLPDSPSTQTISGLLMRADCVSDNGGQELAFVRRQGSLHLLQARYDRPEQERSFEARKVFALPSGRKIEVEPM